MPLAHRSDLFPLNKVSGGRVQGWIVRVVVAVELNLLVLFARFVEMIYALGSHTSTCAVLKTVNCVGRSFVASLLHDAQKLV